MHITQYVEPSSCSILSNQLLLGPVPSFCPTEDNGTFIEILLVDGSTANGTPGAGNLFNVIQVMCTLIRQPQVDFACATAQTGLSGNLQKSSALGIPVAVDPGI